MLLIQNLQNGKEFDDAFGSAVDRGEVAMGVIGLTEADEEPALSAVFAAGL